jgi:hypothetical protein
MKIFCWILLISLLTFFTLTVQIDPSHDSRDLQIVTESTTTACNLSLFTEWKSQTYSGVLASDTDFWIYQTQPQITLNNGLAMQLAVIFCKRQFYHLSYYKAGQSGPISIQNSYIAMCNKYCVQSDLLHQQAMTASSCNCLALSTQSTDSSYTAEGDWCRENSARLLCTTLGYCGIWDCDLDDFMCPRYEWIKKSIAYIGTGVCRSSASRSHFSFLSTSSSSYTTWLIMCLVLLITVGYLYQT